mmetsp:Transcript_1921/g.2478  ORF Transcript_1921/g.2478 Transcript_1921/m.2478 type:complete len:248 (-) Transcript_1921:271-1014(-)|eukprot:CAMPEP_0204822638 /NCGR_PEP_ID=MMETSP1346-20131115/833_1 /ASSEMBLY_ACC=CAM_ASM_000771 /TAXON_ID=215587 /ORGANISM="Aplanochytrium stocchinoi, Strain GSBS06" /LENGTH=247 /DNA_ID=CAMNT_0051948971 /DNA_START=355 /DNA_END=1098 /DNA_ORIENTATION=+
MSCCPPTRVPALVKSESGVGEFVDIGKNTKAYTTGAKHSQNVIIILADIFGYTTGRHLGICDYLAENGYYVIAPDVFKGERYVPIDPNDLSKDVMGYVKKHLIPSIQEVLDQTYAQLIPKTCKWVGLMGFCIGSWQLFHESKRDVLPLLKCGVNFHPSIAIEDYVGGDAHKLAKSVNHPMLLVPTKGDHESVQKGTYLEKEYNCMVADYTHQKHGFMSQGDVDADPKIAEDVIKVLDMTLEYFAKHQ